MVTSGPAPYYAHTHTLCILTDRVRVGPEAARREHFIGCQPAFPDAMILLLVFYRALRVRLIAGVGLPI